LTKGIKKNEEDVSVLLSPQMTEEQLILVLVMAPLSHVKKKRERKGETERKREGESERKRERKRERDCE
jgi:hypothetical protein